MSWVQISIFLQIFWNYNRKYSCQCKSIGQLPIFSPLLPHILQSFLPNSWKTETESGLKFLGLEGPKGRQATVPCSLLFFFNDGHHVGHSLLLLFLLLFRSWRGSSILQGGHRQTPLFPLHLHELVDTLELYHLLVDHVQVHDHVGFRHHRLVRLNSNWNWSNNSNIGFFQYLPFTSRSNLEFFHKFPGPILENLEVFENWEKNEFWGKFRRKN